MLKTLQNPAHLHLLINHLPIIGLGVATLALLLATIARNRGAQIIALLLVSVTAASVWPVYETGENAYRTLRGIADAEGADWLDVHMERADQTVFYFALPVALALLGIFVPRKFPRTALPLNLITLVASFACLGIVSYIADAGGKIRHSEFRELPPPAAEVEAHHHNGS